MSAHRSLADQLLDSSLLIDPGTGATIVPDRDMGLLSVTTGASGQTRILGTPPRAGMELSISLAVDGGGDCVVTQTGSAAVNQAGNTTVTLNDAGDRVTFMSILVGTTLRWRIKSSDGVSLS
jgi:hypothetical protein